VAAVGLSPSTGCWRKTHQNKNFKLCFHWILQNRITAVLESGPLASYSTHLNLSMETKYQMYISNWLIKELFQYVTELCNWASKADLTAARGERPKREKVFLLCGYSVILVCLGNKSVPKTFKTLIEDKKINFSLGRIHSERFLVEESGKKVETWKNAYKRHFIYPSDVLVGL